MCVASDEKARTRLSHIDFYSMAGEYGFLSNFAPYFIQVGGRTWPTSEHYSQARKLKRTPRKQEVRRDKNPMQAVRLGRDRSERIRRDWKSVKDDVMWVAVRARFDQYADIRTELLATGNAELVEHTANDDYWGNGGDGHG